MTTEQREKLIIIEDLLVMHGNLSADNLLRITTLIASLADGDKSSEHIEANIHGHGNDDWGEKRVHDN